VATEDVTMTQGEFTSSTEPFRHELLAHCYRMLGSVDEAEDLVQETYLRAWKAYDRFEGRSSLRVWLYRIATNACLSALEGRGRRPLPSGLVGPSDDPEAPPIMPGTEVTWMQPFPSDPAVIVVERETLRLALIASLQYLPARQRAVLILREVLAFPASEVATMLDTTTAAVKSMLQRARLRLEEVTPDQLEEPTEPEQRQLLDQYIAAFENSDAALLERALRKDATLEMVPSSTWFSGKATCMPYLTTVLGSPGDWRMIRTVANGQPAVAAYLRGDDGAHQAFGIAVLTITAAGITRIVVFGDSELVAKFGFPQVHPGQG
jgi:RNA polymerase sigma-70 factor, ECF subfamily